MTDTVQRLRRSPDDQSAWNDFFQKLYPRVFFVTFRLADRDRTVAEDLAQAAFVRFVQYDCLDKVDNEESAVAFLRVTARNIFYRSLRREDGTVSLESVDDANEPSTSRAADQGLDFKKFFRRLSSDERILLAMSLEGYSLREIADRLGTTYGAAGVRLHRLKARLREQLGHGESSVKKLRPVSSNE